jgi:hypothetical protein
MMKKSNLFGASALDLDAAKLAVEHAFSAAMEAHESAYRGGDYFRLGRDGTELLLQTNFMEDDGEVTEAEHAEAQVLLYVDGEAENVDRVAAAIAKRLSSFRLLRASSY